MNKTGKLSLYDYNLQNNRIQVLQDWHPVKSGGAQPGGTRIARLVRKDEKSGRSLSECYPELVEEWNRERNEGMTPADFTPGSHKKVWWICSKGHEWQADIFARTRGSGCPVCAGRKIIAGENDLETLYPEIAGQWHATKNHGLLPSEVPAHSTRKVWWVCDNGHEWRSQIAARTRGAGCPICSGRQVQAGYNDFASAYPEMATQWMTEKNLPIKPDEITPQSNVRVWWSCDKGHEWQAKVSARVTHNSGCPYCTGRLALAGFNDLATVHPKIAAQWNYERNGELTPEMVTPGSTKKVWWRCSLGHEWQALIYSRTSPRKHGCPYCSGRYREPRKYGDIELLHGNIE